MTAKVVLVIFGAVAIVLCVLLFSGISVDAYFTRKSDALTRLVDRLCTSAEENPVRYAVVLGMIVCGIFFFKSLLG